MKIIFASLSGTKKMAVVGSGRCGQTLRQRTHVIQSIGLWEDIWNK
jgi:hypothetical protein